MRRRPAPVSWYLCVFTAASAIALVAGVAAKPPLNRAAERWVEETKKKLTLNEKIGQLIVPAFESGFLSTDSDLFDELSRLVREYHVGGFHVFGASVPAPPVLLNPAYGTVIGQPFAAAFLVNRLQALSAVPLMNSADFEAGVGFRIAGGTLFPRQMAMGAIARDDALRLVREEARIAGIEARAIGVHVNFAPLADVNNNPRNPVINTRSYGEDPRCVAALVGHRLSIRAHF
jgi:beta-N-acetylhexosaminidase